MRRSRSTISADGRLILGVGLGSSRTGEIERFGEVADRRERARMLDDGLRGLSDYWAGALEPPPHQHPRIPIWVAARWPSRKPLRRAARWDGLFPIELPSPDALATLAAELRERRAGDSGQFDLVAEIAPGEDPSPWSAAGATWVLTSFDSQPHEADVRAVIEAGPSAPDVHQ